MALRNFLLLAAVKHATFLLLHHGRSDAFVRPTVVHPPRPADRVSPRAPLRRGATTATAPPPPAAGAAAAPPPAAPSPRTAYDAIVCGGGPAGLLAAVMLSRQFGPAHRIAVLERRPDPPPSPGDAAVWDDVARFYLLGLGHRGQEALRELGVFEDFERHSVAVTGRRDWQPGAMRVEDGKITQAKKEVTSRVLARDKLVGVLHHHILEHYADTGIELLYGYQAEPVGFGDAAGEEDAVTVRITKCEETTTSAANDGRVVASQDAEQTCAVDAITSKTAFLIGADGSARTVANAMERHDAVRRRTLHPLRRAVAPRPFAVTRFTDDNAKVFKSLPVRLPPDWPRGLNYSARSSMGIVLEALPSDNAGTMCALLLMDPTAPLARAGVPPAELRAFLDAEFPQFTNLVSDADVAAAAAKRAAALPSFRFAGPKLHVGRRTLVLGDAAHTVKPYYGLGANTALEDVRMLGEILEENARDVPRAVRTFSDRRAPDAAALVTMSRNMDRPGKLFFACFLLPLILDGIFHKLAPAIFGPNMFQMFQRRGVTFRQIQQKKRRDRALQILCLGGAAAGAARGLCAAVGALAGATGRSRAIVSLGMAVVVAAGASLRKMAGGKKVAAESK